MSLGKFLSSWVLVTSVSGCTVLGFAADVALNSVFEPEACKSGSSSTRGECDFELVLTQAGIEADIEKAQALLKSAKTKKIEDQNYTLHRPDKPAVVVCTEQKDDKQQCYPAEYYQDMYKK
jgi:hypothetical protein